MWVEPKEALEELLKLIAGKSGNIDKAIYYIASKEKFENAIELSFDEQTNPKPFPTMTFRLWKRHYVNIGADENDILLELTIRSKINLSEKSIILRT